MKNKHFYSYLVETTHITLEISELSVSSKERVHLLSLVEANIHTSVVATVLDQLSDEDKKIFLTNLSKNNHQIIWEHLNQKGKNIETKIKKTIENIVEELFLDVKQARRLKN